MTFNADSPHPIIVWVGRQFAHDGYGTAARAHLGALRAMDAPVVAVDLGSRSLVGSVPQGLVRASRTSDGDLTIRAVDPDRPMTIVVHERPDQYVHVATEGRCRWVGYSYWETTS